MSDAFLEDTVIVSSKARFIIDRINSAAYKRGIKCGTLHYIDLQTWFSRETPEVEGIDINDFAKFYGIPLKGNTPFENYLQEDYPILEKVIEKLRVPEEPRSDD